MNQFTITENERGYDYPSATLASHIFSLTSGNYSNAAGATSVTVPAPSLKVKYNTSANGRSGVDEAAELKLYINGTLRGSTGYWMPITKLAANTDKVLPITYGDTSYIIGLSSLFTSSNPTVRSIPFTWAFSGTVATGVYSTGQLIIVGFRNNATASVSEGAIVLNAPPTFTGATQTTGPYYQYVNPYTVSVADLSAKYGGTISEVKLTIGTQTATRTDNGTLSITPNVAGIFTPAITVTDSRGQVSSLNLDPITVIANVVGINSVSADRVDATGIRSDEGTNAVIPLTMSYTQFTSNYLLEPTVTVDGNIPSDITWYANWTASGGFSNPIDWTNYAPSSPVTIYGWIKDTLSDSSSHSLAVKVASSYAESSEITFTLPQAFFLLVGRPGGKGLGIGMKPTSDDLWVGMDIKLYLDQTATSGTDYELIQALNNIGWSDLI